MHLKSELEQHKTRVRQIWTNWMKGITIVALAIAAALFITDLVLITANFSNVNILPYTEPIRGVLIALIAFISLATLSGIAWAFLAQEPHMHYLSLKDKEVSPKRKLVSTIKEIQEEVKLDDAIKNIIL